MTGPASPAPSDPGELHPETALLAKIPIGYARRHLLLPCRTPAGDVVLLSGGKPEAREAIDEMRFLAGSTRVVCAPENEVLARIDAAYERAHSPENEIVEGLPGEWDLDPTAAIEETRDLLESPDEAPVIRFVHAVLFRAIRERSSDIHFEPYEKELVVRNRVDGILYPMITAPRKWHAPAVSRVKVMAGLDIAERRLPQDGRIKIRLGGREIDIRVSTVPTSFGERAVLRLLDRGNVLFGLADMGFDPADLATFERFLSRSSGILLVTGPTGSGKTTTLYAALRHLDSGTKNIITIEDPGGVPVPGDRADPGEPEDPADVRQRPALHPAPGPRHHHGGRDPGRGDGRDRHPGVADRAPGPFDAPHQRFGQRGHAPRGHGDRAVPRRLLPLGRRRPAAGAAPVPRLQDPLCPHRRGCAERGAPLAARDPLLPAGRMREVPAAPGIWGASRCSRSSPRTKRSGR